jgi:urease gamma subunit
MKIQCNETNLLFGSGTSPHPARRFIRGVRLNRSEEIRRITTGIVAGCINRREFPILLAIGLAVGAEQRAPVLARRLPVT